MMPQQLAFPFFIGEPEPVLPRPSRYRRLPRLRSNSANVKENARQSRSGCRPQLFKRP
jgi:hypothetical protein